MTQPLHVDAFPLQWPSAWPRRRAPAGARFRVASVAAASSQILAELRRLGAREIVISSNLELRLDGLPRSGQRAPADPAVAVYFTLKGKPTVLACDAWNRVEDNLVAIARHVEAIRGQIRWGVGTLDQAFHGYAALPPGPANGSAARRPWWVVLEFDDPAQTPEVVRETYRALAKVRHPDQGGSSAAFAELVSAYEDGLRATGGSSS